MRPFDGPAWIRHLAAVSAGPRRRVTVASVVRELERAEWFAGLPFHVVSRRTESVVKSGRSFVPVAQYARGMIPRDGEIGYDGGTRFFKAGTKFAGRDR